VNVDGTASFEPIVDEIEKVCPADTAHTFNWITGGYEHSSADRTLYSLTATTDCSKVIPEETYTTPNMDGYKMTSIVEPVKKSDPGGYEAGSLCSNLKYETRIRNAPSLFMIYADGSGARLWRDADMYPYIKNLAVNSNCEVVEESVEAGVSVSVLESNTFRQVR
jgi:hypothetical protein